MSIVGAIKASFPSADINPLRGNVTMQDDGKGPYIAAWDASAIGAPKPTQAALDAIVGAYVPPSPPKTLEERVAALEAGAKVV